MRMSWRTTAWIVTLAFSPLAGCHQVPGDKSVQDLRPIQPVGKDKKQDLTSTEIMQTWSAKADKLQRDGQTDAALALCEKMREPGNPQAMQATRKIALIYDRSDDLDRAEQEYQRILMDDPKDATALYKLGDLAYRRNRWGIAEKYLTKALAVRPDYTEARFTLGMTLAQSNFYTESVQEFSKVVPKSEAYCKLAFILKLNGKVQDAIRAYETALTIEPGMPLATAELARLRQGANSTVSYTTPYAPGTKAAVELETPRAPIGGEPGREMMQRPTLPPLPEVDWSANKQR